MRTIGPMKRAARHISPGSMPRKLIFENTGKAIKTHSGVQREFARLANNEPRIDAELRAFLPRTYNFKAIADYATGPGSQVSVESAREAILTARRFVECVTTLIPPNGRRPRVPEAPKP